MNRLLVSLFGLLFAVAVSAQDMRKNRTEILGDAMGQTPANVASTYTAYYYDQDGKQVRMANYGRLYDSGEYILSRFTSYDFDAAGHVLKSWSEQYGVYDGEDMAYRESSDTTYFAYDEAGHRIEESVPGYQRIRYTYEGDNLVKVMRYMWTVGSDEPVLSETTEYSEFVSGNPTRIHNTGRWESYMYDGVINYDAKGHKVSELHYSQEEPTKLVGAEYWTYNASGMLTLYEKKYVDEKGVAVDYMRTLYSMQNNDPNRILSRSQTTFDGGGWSNNATQQLEIFSDYTGKQAPVLKAEALAGQQTNSAVLKIAMPAAALLDAKHQGVKILDRGLVLATLSIEQAKTQGYWNESSQQIEYTLSLQHNGYHEYMAQAVELDDDERVIGEWLVSDIAPLSFDAPIPAPQNVHVVRAERNTNGTYNVDVAWDAVENAADYGFERYNVMVNHYSVAENREDEGQTTQWTIEGVRDAFTLYVQAVYPVGKANSEVLTVDPKMYVEVLVDTRLCVEEVVTYKDASIPADKTVNFYGADKQLQRIATYQVAADGTETLLAYGRIAPLEDGKLYQITGKIPGDVFQLVERTYNEETGFLTTETIWSEDGTTNVVKTFSYDVKGFLKSVKTQTGKLRSNGKVALTTVSNVEYTNDPNDELLVKGTYYTYNGATASWVEAGSVVRYMMPANDEYVPVVVALGTDENKTFIKILPPAEHQNDLAAFTVYCNGEVVERAVPLRDENHLQESESGELISWDYFIATPEFNHEIIVQYVELDDYGQYKRAYGCSEILAGDGYTAIASVKSADKYAQARYNLQGQRVDGRYRGIVLQNGKKMLVK